MKAFQLEIDCLMDDGTTLTAVVDQRDHAAFEGSELYDSVQPGSVTKARWLAWNALRRSKLTSETWPKFNGETCVQAVITQAPDDEAEQEGEQEPDPSRS